MYGGGRELLKLHTHSSLVDPDSINGMTFKTAAKRLVRHGVLNITFVVIKMIFPDATLH